MRILKFFNKNSNKIYFKFILSYLLILGISFIISLFIFARFSETVISSVLEKRQSLIKQSANAIDSTFSEADYLVNTLTIYDNLNKVLNMRPKLSREKFSVIKNIQDYFPPYGDGIQNCFIIIPKQDIVISRFSTYYIQYFNNYNMKDLGISEKIWTNINSTKYFKQIIGGEIVDGKYYSYPSLYYLHSLPVTSGTPTATIMTLLNHKKIEQSLQWVKEEKCDFYILNQNSIVFLYGENVNTEVLNMPLAGSGYFKTIINNKEVFISHHTSLNNGLTYVSITTPQIILAEANIIKQQIILLLFAFLTAGIFIAIFLSYLNAKPLADIILTLTDYFKPSSKNHGKDLNYMRLAISELITNDSDLRRKINENMKSIQVEHRQRLLKGEIILNEDFDYYLLGDVFGIVYTVLAIEICHNCVSHSIDNLIEINIIKGIISDIEISSDKMKSFYVNMEEDHCAFLITSNETDEQKINEKIEIFAQKIIEKIKIQSNKTIRFAIGSFVKKLPEVYYSYIEAQDLLDSGLVSEGSLKDTENNMQDFMYYFPLNVEQRLISTVMAGNSNEMKNIMDLIYDHNFMLKEISTGMIKHLYREIDGTIYKLVATISCSLKSEEIYQIYITLKELRKNLVLLQPKQVFDIYMDLLAKVCDYISSRQNDKNIERLNQMKLYMDENYKNPDFCLSLMAEHFQFSEIYMSNFIRLNLKITFTDYVEALRINSAHELLLNTDLTINEISTNVGYRSSHTFRRAFKRIVGVLPTEVRASN